VLLAVFLGQHTGKLLEGSPHVGSVKKARLAGYLVNRQICLIQQGFCNIKMSLDYLVVY
jgi:hypothetical protein